MSSSYPEYLNPFAEDSKPKRKSTIRSSFSKFTRSMRQSFRIKKKDEEVAIRHKPGMSNTFRRLPMSYPATEALPRSRFRERLSKPEENANSGPNPFEEDDSSVESKSVTIRRRGKKRAPLPPMSLSSQNVNDDQMQIPSGCSTWSLTSADTDYSTYGDRSVNEDEQDDDQTHEVLEKFKDFNTQMEKLKDDRNNNIVEEEVKRQASVVVPDLVISCPSEEAQNKSDEVGDEDIQPACDLLADNIANEEENEPKNTDEETKEACHLVGDNKTNEAQNESENDSGCDLVAPNITKDAEESKPEPNDIDQNEAFLYHEKKSLYVAGSRDELNRSESYTGRVSLYITGSCDDLDATNNNNSIIDENSNDDVAPTPKQRKNKLSKNMLLGT